MNKAQSQQYAQVNNSYYSQSNNQNSAININNSGASNIPHSNQSSYIQQLKLQKQMNSDSLAYSAHGGARYQHPVYGLGMNLAV